MSSSSDSNKKSFGNCRVEWRIDKFSLQTLTKHWSIESPEFPVNGYEETKWYMNLRSKLVSDRNFVLFTLKRSANDSGPKFIRLNVKICLKISGEKLICLNDKVMSLKKGSKYEACFGSMESLLSKMYLSDDILAILCHMIVCTDRASTEFGECNHAGLKLLSKNMLDLYLSSHDFDTEFVVRDGVILAHKAILCARNEYLGSMIEEYDDEFTIIRVPVIDKPDYEAMRKVLAYLYTGDIRHVLEKPSFAVYHCASSFEISEIETHYKPDKWILQSTIDIEEYSYALRGYEFKNGIFIWQCQRKEFTKTYRLLFYPNREVCEDCIPLFTKTFATSMLARVEFYFVNQTAHLFTTYLVNDGYVNIDKMGTMNGIIKKLVFNHDASEVSELRINLKLSAGIKMSYLDKFSSFSASYMNEDIYYERLSTDLEFLLDSGPYTDTVIDNNGIFFWVHKCILAARSHLFSHMLITTEEGEAIVVPNLDPHTVSVILTYIYSGYLSGVMDDDVVEVYKAAVMTSFPQLKSMCSDWLKLSSKTNKDIRCRALKIAEKYKDPSLMKSILNHLFETQERVLFRSFNSFQDVNTCRHCLSS